ncbi:hypothetical protein KC359_g193 [Hortaea werneckii]|nr:hypothetical protein KC359_g193 [Hortaea werneckii]
MDQFLKSVPHGDSEYMNMLRQTQAFNEFIHERESTRAEDPSIKLFDEIILSKRNRGRTSLFSRSNTSFLSDTSDHLWRNASATQPNGRVPGDRVPVSGRTPASLDPTLMSEPRAIQGAPRLQQARTKRKPVASMLGLSSQRSIGMDPFLGRMGGLVFERPILTLVGAKEERRYFQATEIPLGIDGGRPITPILDLGDSYDKECKRGKRRKKKYAGMRRKVGRSALICSCVDSLLYDIQGESSWKVVRPLPSTVSLVGPARINPSFFVLPLLPPPARELHLPDPPPGLSSALRHIRFLHVPRPMGLFDLLRRAEGDRHPLLGLLVHVSKHRKEGFVPDQSTDLD